MNEPYYLRLDLANVLRLVLLSIDLSRTHLDIACYKGTRKGDKLIRSLLLLLYVCVFKLFEVVL
jgi:hypothetical protein